MSEIDKITLREDGFTVTASDTTTYDPPIVLDIITAGDVKVVTKAGNTRTITVGNNYRLGCLVTKVFSTDTTASGFIGYPLPL